MKKFVIGVITYFIFIILYFIQANFFGWFTIAGISPNIFVIYILFLGIITAGVVTFFVLKRND